MKWIASIGVMEQLRQFVAQPVDDLTPGLDIGVYETEQKFLTAISKKQIVWPQMRKDVVRNCDQNLISRAMAIGIVYYLKMIDIYH